MRQKAAEQKRVLDDVSRRRRQRKALEALEYDNFSEDPHADLKMSKKAPKFEEAMDVTGKQAIISRECFRPHELMKSFTVLNYLGVVQP